MGTATTIASNSLASPKLWGVAGPVPPDSVVFGNSPVMQSVWRNLKIVAAANVPVLIDGESGTGKEIIAKMIHLLSPWNNGPYVKVNCPAIPGTLLESELFGYEKGAFTGAYGAKPGRVEMAHRGSLFLDEIGEMDQGLQAKLLQLLQDGEFCKIGGQENQRVEVRVVCATNRDLAEEVQQGRFRQDLLYRINVVSIHLPPLRERKEDIPALVDYFLETFSRMFNTKPPRLPGSAVEILQSYAWPGNIRELENTMKRYVILGALDIAESPEPVRNGAFRMPEFVEGKTSLKEITKKAVREIEREVILKTLKTTNWNRKEAARRLRISYRALIYKIQEAGLTSDDRTS